jgi:tRNA-(ms[2]io[6]A)-hydroxylase
MLNLAAPSDPRWVGQALAHLDDILLDHAHCEKKAAGAAITLLFQYPHHEFLQAPLARLAREELSHFELVLARLEQRGIAFGRQKPSPYGGKLRTLVRAREPEHLLDLLLVASLIEARSCERFQLLAEAIDDNELAGFYRDLLASEARHHGVYVELAGRLVSESAAGTRLVWLAEREAAIVAEPAHLVRLHT